MNLSYSDTAATLINWVQNKIKQIFVQALGPTLFLIRVYPVVYAVVDRDPPKIVRAAFPVSGRV